MEKYTIHEGEKGPKIFDQDVSSGVENEGSDDNGHSEVNLNTVGDISDTGFDGNSTTDATVVVGDEADRGDDFHIEVHAGTRR